MYVDPSRSTTALQPDARTRCATRIVSGQLIRDRAVPTTTVAPFSYGAYGAPRGAGGRRAERGDRRSPRRSPRTGWRSPATLNAGDTRLRDVAQVSVRLLIGQKTGAKATTMELNTDVALRNAIRL